MSRFFPLHCKSLVCILFSLSLRLSAETPTTVQEDVKPDQEKKFGEVLGGFCVSTTQISVRQDLQPGQIEFQLHVPVGFVADNEGKPISFSPDIWYQMGRFVKLGLTHSQSGTNGFWLGTGTSLCLSGEDSGCNNIYSNAALRTLVTLYKNDLVHILADTGLILETLEPSKNTSARVAFLFEVVQSNIKFRINPGMHFALTGQNGSQTDLQDRINKNENEFYLPFDLSLMLFRPLRVGFQLGIRASTHDFIDSYTIPVNLSTLALLNEHMALGASYGFRNLLGPGENSSDLRDLQFFLNIRI